MISRRQCVNGTEHLPFTWNGPRQVSRRRSASGRTGVVSPVLCRLRRRIVGGGARYRTGTTRVMAFGETRRGDTISPRPGVPPGTLLKITGRPGRSLTVSCTFDGVAGRSGVQPISRPADDLPLLRWSCAGAAPRRSAVLEPPAGVSCTGTPCAGRQAWRVAVDREALAPAGSTIPPELGRTFAPDWRRLTERRPGFNKYLVLEPRHRWPCATSS